MGHKTIWGKISLLLAGTMVVFSSSAFVIRPVGVLYDEYVYTGGGATNIINNSGLSATLNTGDALSKVWSITHVYDGGWKQSYASTAPGGGGSDFFAEIATNYNDTDVDIILDMGSNVTFRSVLLWQYQNQGSPDGTRAANALRTLELRINTEAEGTNSFSSTADVTLTMKPVTDGNTDGTDDMNWTNSVQAFNTGELTGRYILLSLTDNYYGLNGMQGGGDRVGLGEIRFATEEIVVPEPAAISIILLTGAGFIFLRRRLGS